MCKVLSISFCTRWLMVAIISVEVRISLTLRFVTFISKLYPLILYLFWTLKGCKDLFSREHSHVKQRQENLWVPNHYRNLWPWYFWKCSLSTLEDCIEILKNRFLFFFLNVLRPRGQQGEVHISEDAHCIYKLLLPICQWISL